MENSQNNQQTQPTQTATHQPNQKLKQTRTRKTIDQELAELEARRQKLLESKKKAETHEKIIFGATVIAMLKDMQKTGDKNGDTISKVILAFTKVERPKDMEIIEKIIKPILEIKPDKKSQQ